MGAKLIDDRGFEEGIVETLDADGWSRSTSVRRKVRAADSDDEPDTVPDEEPPGWAKPE